jgi:hypothetical protein
MARMGMTYTTREMRKCNDGGGGIECDYDDARAGAMMRWSRSDSSRIKEAHRGEDSIVTCVRASTTKVVKRCTRS